MFALRPEAREFKPSGVDMALPTTDNADSTVNNSSKYRCANDVKIPPTKTSGISPEFHVTTLDSVDQRPSEEIVHRSFSRKDRINVAQAMPSSRVANTKISTNKEGFPNCSHGENGDKYNVIPSHPLKEEQFIRTTLNPDAPPFVPTVDPPFLFDNSTYCDSATNSAAHSTSTLGNANVMSTSGPETIASQSIKQTVVGSRLIMNPSLTYLTSYPITDESLLQPLDKSFHPDASVCTTSPYVTPTAHQYMAHIGDTVRPIVGNNDFSKFCVTPTYTIATPINTVNFRPASPCALQQPCTNTAQHPTSDIRTIPGSFETVNGSTSPNNSLPKSSYRVTTPVVQNSSNDIQQSQRSTQDKVMVPNDLNKVQTKDKEFVQTHSDTKKKFHSVSNARLTQENISQPRPCKVKLNDTLTKVAVENPDKVKKEQFVKEIDKEKRTVSQLSRQNYTFINKERHSVKHSQNGDMGIGSEKKVDADGARMDVPNQTKLNENLPLGKSSRVANSTNPSNVNSNESKSADFKTIINHLENTHLSKRSTKRNNNTLTTSTTPLRKQPVVASGKQRGDSRCGAIPSKQNGRNNKSVNRGKKFPNVTNQFTTSVSKSTAGQDAQVETSMTCLETSPKKEDLESSVQSKPLVKEKSQQPAGTLPRVSTRKEASWAELVRSGPSKPVATPSVPSKPVATQPVPSKPVATQPEPSKPVVNQPTPSNAVVTQPSPAVLPAVTSTADQILVQSSPVQPLAVSVSVPVEKNTESVVSLVVTPVASGPITVDVSQEKRDVVTQAVGVVESADCVTPAESCSHENRGNKEDELLSVAGSAPSQHVALPKQNGIKKSINRDNESVTPYDDEQKSNRVSRNGTTTRYKQPTSRSRGDGRLRGDNTNRRQYDSQAKFQSQKSMEGTYSNRGRHTHMKRDKRRKEDEVSYEESVLVKECVINEEYCCTKKEIPAVEEKLKPTTWVSVARGESKIESVIEIPQKILSGPTEVTHVSSSKRKIGNAPLNTIMQPLGASCGKNNFVLKPQSKPTHDTGANVAIQNTVREFTQERPMFDGTSSSMAEIGQSYVEASATMVENNFQEPRHTLRKTKAYAHPVAQSYTSYSTVIGDDMNGISTHRVEPVHRHRAVKLMNAPMPVAKPIVDHSFEQHKNTMPFTDIDSKLQDVTTSSHKPTTSPSVVTEKNCFNENLSTIEKCEEECKTGVVNDACIEKNVYESTSHEAVNSSHDVLPEKIVKGIPERENIAPITTGTNDKESVIQDSNAPFKVFENPLADSSMQEVKYTVSNLSEGVSKPSVVENKDLLQTCEASTPPLVHTNTTQATSYKSETMHRVGQGFFKNDELRYKTLNCSTFGKENGKSIEQVLENSKHIFKDMKPSFSKDMTSMTHYHNSYYASVAKENKFLDKQPISSDHGESQSKDRCTPVSVKDSLVVENAENGSVKLNELSEEKVQEKIDTVQGNKRLLKAPATRVYSIRLMVTIREIMLQKHELISPELVNETDTTKYLNQSNFGNDPSRKCHMKLFLHPKSDRQFNNECSGENSLTFYDSKKKDSSENIQYIWRRQGGTSTNDSSPTKGNYQGNAGGLQRSNISYSRQGTKHSFSNTRGKNTTTEDDLAGVWRMPTAPAETSRLAIASRITDHKELIERSLRALLNKLTMEKFDTLYEKIRLSGMVDREDIKCLMRLICSKAKTQHHFIPMYVKLCVRLHEDIPKLNVKMEDESEFRRLLVDACQTSFEETLKPIVVPEGLNEEDTFEYILYEKKKMKGNMIFVGELGKTRMIAGRVIYNCINSLIANRGEAQLEALCVLMRTTGEYMESQKFRDSFIQKLETVAELAKDQTISKRLRCLLQDVVDDSRNGWVKSKKEKDGPKKLNDLRKELESRQKPTLNYRTDYNNTNSRQMNQKESEEDFQPVSGKRHTKMNKPQNSTQDFVRSNTLKNCTQFNSNNRMDYNHSQLGRLSTQPRVEYSNNSFHRNTTMKRGTLSGKDSYHKENDSSSLPFFDANGKNKHEILEDVEDLLNIGNVSSIKELSCVKLPDNSIVLEKTGLLRKEQPSNVFDTEKGKEVVEASSRGYRMDNAEACKESLDSIRLLIESHTLTEQNFSYLIGIAITLIAEARVVDQRSLVQWLLDWRKQGFISSEHFNFGFIDFIKTRYHSVKYDAPNLQELLVNALKSGEEQNVFSTSFVQEATDLIQKAEKGEFRTED